eukprot:78332_1
MSKQFKTSYKYRTIYNDQLWSILKTSSFYEDWKTRFNKIFPSCKDIDSAILSETQTNNKRNLIKRIQCIKPDFKENMIHIKADDCVEAMTLYVKDKHLYLSKDVLNDEMKLLQKSLEAFYAQIEDILRCYVKLDYSKECSAICERNTKQKMLDD